MRMDSSRGHAIAEWVIAVVAYGIAILCRSSLAAVGDAATAHLQIGSDVLSFFVLLQLFVYAGMQIPAGILLDRRGPRWMLVASGVIMGTGQAVVAMSSSAFSVAAGRAVIGAGDALAFVSVLRFIAQRYPEKWVPGLSQLASVGGQLFQFVSISPVIASMNAWGWTATFGSLSVICVVSSVMTAMVLPGNRLARRKVRNSKNHSVMPVCRVLLDPAVHVAFWAHFLTPFSSNVFGLLWGYQFLVHGLGDTEQAAAHFMELYVAVTALGSLAVGALTTRWPRCGLVLVVASVCIQVLAWAGVLSGGFPRSVSSVILATILGLGGPVSVAALDIPRHSLPSMRRGLGTSVANMGGFVATVAALLLIGVSLGSGRTHSAAEYAAALSTQLWVFGVGVVGISVAWLRWRAGSKKKADPVHTRI